MATRQESADRRAFDLYLRTGEKIVPDRSAASVDLKYNHNHDELGRFTFAWNNVGGGQAQMRASASPIVRPTAHRAAPIRGATHSATAKPRGIPVFKQVGSHPAGVYRTRAGNAIIDPRSGSPMLIPKGVSMQNTVRVARMFGSPLNREAAAVMAFEPGGPMDFQRTYSTLRDRRGGTLIDQRFVAIGNYNFGVYAAASGMSLKNALAGAATVYAAQTLNLGGNPRNESLIVSGYRDFQNGNVGN